MTTATAQDRLLEALAVLERESDGGIDGLLFSIPMGVDLAAAGGCPELAHVWRCVGDLAAAVQSDLKGTTHG